MKCMGRACLCPGNAIYGLGLLQPYQSGISNTIKQSKESQFACQLP